MAQRIHEQGPDDQIVEALEHEIHTQGTQHDRPKRLIGKDGALEEIGLDDGKGQQDREAIADRHG